MQRDYKPAASGGRRQSRKKRATGPSFSIRSFGYGTLFGVGLALVFNTLLPALQDRAESAVPELRELTRQGKTPPPPPKFEFYTILPEMEVAVPEQTVSPPNGTEPGSTQQKSQYVLQVGSFRDPNDADRLRAGLLLEDFTATTQTVTIDQETWYRVRVGPFDSRRKMDATRARLSDRGYRSMMLQLRPTDASTG